ncbi:MAG: tripartite tricarboxylate transporter substrate binding protein [Proteobacteria bacterium]|nr:tripartite tricarboxylate transporter substrate binding protein [Pseudomonadota bacterium]
MMKDFFSGAQRRMRWSAALALAAGLACGAAPVSAAYPDKPIKIVTTASPGAATDITARLMAEQMTKILKQQVLVESRPGGGGNIGVGYVAEAKPDGYTLLITSTALVAAPYLYKTLSYDPEKSFAPISELTTFYNMLVTHADYPTHTLPEFMKLAREKSVSMAGGNIGGASWVMMTKLNKMGNLKLEYIAYKGTGPAVTDVLGGHVDTVMTDPASVKAFLADGKLRAIGMTAPKRSAAYPNVPAFAEAIPGYQQQGWIGMFAPAGTPADVVQTLYKAVAQALEDPAVRARLTEGDFGIVGSTPEQFSALVKSEIATYGKVITEAGVKPE